jgi:predicted amidohydrolase
MTAMRVAIIQLGYDDEESTATRVERVAQLVRDLAGHDLVVLPELWQPTGFGYRRWAALAEPVDGPLVHAMARAARAAGVVLHAGSWIETNGAGPDGRGLWNTSMVFGPDGSLLATYRKVHRFGFGQGEPLLLEAGSGIVTVDLPRPATAPESPSVPTGLATCYDLRFPEQFRMLLDAGAELFVVPAAWPAARVEHWQLLGRARALENQSFMVQCNTAGTHAGIEMGGRSQVVDPWGVVLAEAGTDEEVLSVEIDVDGVAAIREKFPVLGDRRL